MMNRWDFSKALYNIIPNISQGWPILPETKKRKTSIQLFFIFTIAKALLKIDLMCKYVFLMRI